MKKLCMITGLLIVVISLQAQLIRPDTALDKKKKLALIFDIVFGYQHSHVSGESTSYNGSVGGIEAGIGISVVKFSDGLGLRSGIQYDMRGGKYKEGSTYEPGGGGGSYGGYEGSIRMSYISMPVVARYQPPGGFFAEAGLQPALLISAKEKMEGQTYDMKDQVNKLDVGAVVAAGYRFGKHIGVCARVVPGLTNINKKESGYPEKKDHNFAIGVRASWSF